MITTAELHRVAEKKVSASTRQINIDKIVRLFYYFTKHQSF
jgi:hypothetical protein